MGQKINPVGFRIGIIRDWNSKWYVNKKSFVPDLQEDIRIRNYIDNYLKNASIDKITIERTEPTRLNLTIRTAKPGIVIGRGGSDVERLRKELSKITSLYKGSRKRININIVEIRRPDLNANLVGQQIASDLERRVAFRRAMHGAIQRSRRAGAKGVRVMVSGRLNGADMARTEQFTEGTVPLHTLRADIDFAGNEAKTSYGHLGIKTWIYRGNAERGHFLEDKDLEAANSRSSRQRQNRRRNSRSRRPRQNSRQNSNTRHSKVEGGKS